jgi:hypothetical protein
MLARVTLAVSAATLCAFTALIMLLPTPATTLETAATAAGGNSFVIDDVHVFDGERSLCIDTGGNLAWTPTSDVMMGGTSTASVLPVAEGAAESSDALRVQATVSDAFAYPWAGACVGVLPEGNAASVADYGSITLDVRSTAARYKLMLFTEGAYGAPPTMRFDAGPEWSRITLPLSGFGEVDLGRVTGLAIVSPPHPGDYRFDIDNVRLLQ